MKKLLFAIISLFLLIGCSEKKETLSTIAEKQMYSCFENMSDENEKFTIIDAEKIVSNDSLFCCRIKVNSSLKKDYIILDYVYIKIFYRHNGKIKEKEMLLNPLEYAMGDIFKWSEAQSSEFDKVMDKVEESVKRWEEKQGNTYEPPTNNKSREERLYESLYMWSISHGRKVREYNMGKI